MPTANISEIAVHLDVPEGHYMVSNEGCYDHAQENRSICNSEINNIYNHSIDRVYDSAKTDLTNNTISDRYMDFKENYVLSLEMPVPSQGHYGFHSFPVMD